MNYDLINNNTVELSGEVIDNPKYSHEIYNEAFYEFSLKVMRLSDTFDIVPVTISEKLLFDNKIDKGVKISASGQFRSFNKMEDGKSKLMLTMFIRDLKPYDENLNPNKIEIVGYICKEPVYRTTPFKREICDVLLAVNRNYNKSDYLPCIAWGRNARFVKNLQVGDKVVVSGRIQSREYQKRQDNGIMESHIAYEVSLSQVSLEGRQIPKLSAIKEVM